METRKIIHYTVLFLFVIISLFGCSQKYFDIPSDSHCNNTTCCTDEFVASDYSQYHFELNPKVFYKNNNQTIALMSDSSKLLSASHFFYMDPKRKVWQESTENYMENNWYKLDLYVENNGNWELEKGDKIILRSISGRTVAGDKKEAKLIHVFCGKIGKAMEGKSNVFVALFDHMTIINSKKSASKKQLKNKLKEKDGLAFIFKQIKKKNTDGVENAEMIVIGAIIDINYHNKNDGSIIYQLKDIFGEEIWMMKQ